MVAIYVLQLVRGKYYVGMTRKNVERIWQHIDGKGAAWTKKYPPKEGDELLEYQSGRKVADEDKKTLEMMAKYGVRNVRGGSWCRVKMSAKMISDLERKIKPKTRKPAQKTTRKKAPAKKPAKRSPSGYCIRCKDRKKLDLLKPLCLDCYDEWRGWGNPDHEEECCHKCGRKWSTSLAKPVCIHCYRKLTN